MNLELIISRIPDVVGIIGVILTLAAYYFINVSKWKSESLKYVLCNLFGSSFLMISLMFHWNLSSVVIEIAWISISVIGLARYLKAQKQRNNVTNIVPFEKKKIA